MDQYRAKILLVDDEDSNLIPMKKILEQEAYQVATARHASAALTLFKKHELHLVLTDLRIPGVSGPELLRALRKESKVPVIVLTAYGTVNDAVEAMKLGAVDFLAKPLRRDALLRCVQDALSRGIPETSGGKFSFLGSSTAIAQ